MSPFVFRLEKVRRMRQSMEDVAREQLATSLAAQREAEAALGAARTRVHGALDTHRRIAALSGASAADLIAAQAYLERLETERSVATRVNDSHEDSVNERRAELATAARDREALDRLRQRRESAHRLKAQRADANALDELALRGHQRGKAA